MASSLSKYFKFDYWKFLAPLIRSGIYRKDTIDLETKRKIMTTIFYLDGDVFTELYMDNDELLVETYKEKAQEHMESLTEEVQSMNIFYTQIKGIVFAISTLVTAIFVFYKQVDPYIGAPLSLGIPVLVTLLSKYWLKGIVWLIQKLVVPLIQSYGRSS